MDKILKVKSTIGNIEEITLKKLDESFLSQIMCLQEEVVQALEDRTLYVASTEQEFSSCIQGEGLIIGAVTKENKLIAFGMYLEKKYEEENYAYDLGLEGEAVLGVGQVEATIVHSAYRGNGLQKIMCVAIEDYAREKGNSILAATAAPHNTFSVNSFLSLGYEIKKEKLKYGGLRRYVLAKYL